LQAYDYTSAGAYFITVVTQERACWFGDIADGQVRLNDPGKMVETAWSELPGHYPGVDLDAFIIMPNHVHGIIVLVGAGPRACPDLVVGAGPRACPDRASTSVNRAPPPAGQPQGVAPTPPHTGVARTMSLGDVVHRFKSLTTKRYAYGVRQLQWPPFAGRLWQRNYYEHIVRNDADLDRIRQYIEDNPARWAEDPDNPQSVGAAPRGRPKAP
jgi:REP element-mobilizing transposase RayT